LLPAARSWLGLLQWWRGTYAEYVVVKETEAALKPKSIDHIHAAAIPVVALTAWQALFDQAGLSKGQKVLIHGAAGGVGSIAVQLAKWKGAHVIGTASGRNQGLLRELGVDEPIDYEVSCGFARSADPQSVHAFTRLSGPSCLARVPSR
jgi:NADPH:quinone reductase-like Zn-dependent oxidoreductase